MAVFVVVGVGSYYAQSCKSEVKGRLCENGYVASLFQIQGITGASWMAGRIISIIPYAPLRVGAMAANALVPAASLVLCPTLAAVRQGHYKQLAASIRDLAGAYFPHAQAVIPEDIDPSRATLFVYFYDNFSRIVSVGVLVGTITLPFFGYGALGARMAAPMVYGSLAATLAPARVNHFVVKVIPLVVSAVAWTGEKVCTKVYSFIGLPVDASGGSETLLKKVEKFILQSFRKDGPAVEEVELRYMQPGVLSVAEINFILQNDDQDRYVIDLSNSSQVMQKGFQCALEDTSTFCCEILGCILRKYDDDYVELKKEEDVLTKLSVEGKAYFSSYIKQEISSLVSLTQEQQESFTAKFGECSKNQKVLQGYFRLFFVMQGILKVTLISECFEMISGEIEDELEGWVVLGQKSKE